MYTFLNHLFRVGIANYDILYRKYVTKILGEVAGKLQLIRS